MGKVIPITFDEVEEYTHEEIPDEVITSINYLIKKNYDSYKVESNVTLDDIVSNYYGPLKLCEVREKLLRWNIEGLYGKYGWDVEFRSPDRGEYFKPYYLFSKK